MLTETGGSVSLTNSNSDFGNFGLFSDGLSPLICEYQAFGNYATNDFEYLIRGAGIEDFPPYLGLICEPVEPYYNVSEVRIINAGGIYAEPPLVTFQQADGRNGIPAEAAVSLTGGAVTEVNLISSGGQYTEAQVETWFDPELNVNRKVLKASEFSITGGAGLELEVLVEPVYYTINSVTRVQGMVPPTYKVVFEENVPFPILDGEAMEFYQPSIIVSSSHTFEFIGGGVDILTATPSSGAQFIAANETVQVNGGRVAATSSDQGGNFKIGEGITINNARGTIEGEAFERSIFNVVSPFIIAIGE